MSDPDELRKLAAWYREFAEHGGNITIWAPRLQTAEELEEDLNVMKEKQVPRIQNDLLTINFASSWRAIRNDLEWRRIGAALAGAQAAMKEVKKF